MRNVLPIAALILLLPTACGEPKGDLRLELPPYSLWVEAVNDSLNMLHLAVEGEEKDCISIRQRIYRLDGGDLTCDGIPEVCLGVENRTRYWHEEARRIHIYRLYHGQFIRPLWLGSRVGCPLEDFEVCRDSVPACIHTRERMAEREELHRTYILQGFGLRYAGEWE